MGMGNSCCRHTISFNILNSTPEEATPEIIFSNKNYISRVFLCDITSIQIFKYLEIFGTGKLVLTNSLLSNVGSIIDLYSKNCAIQFYQEHFPKSKLPACINDGKRLFFLRYYNEMVNKFSKFFFNKIYRNGINERSEYDFEKEFHRGEFFMVNKNEYNAYEYDYYIENPILDVQFPHPLIRQNAKPDLFSTIETKYGSLKFELHRKLNNFAILNYQNKIIVAGGEERVNKKFCLSKKIYAVNLSNGEITLLHFELNYARKNFSMFILENKIYVYGGISSLEYGIKHRLINREIEVIDLENGTCELLHEELKFPISYDEKIYQFRYKEELYQIGKNFPDNLSLWKKNDSCISLVTSFQNDYFSIISFCFFDARIYFLKVSDDKTIYWEFFDLETGELSNLSLEDRILISNSKYTKFIDKFYEVYSGDDDTFGGIAVLEE